MLQAVLFDLDGTLLDTSGDLAGALNRLRQEHQLPALSLAEVRAEVSNGASALIRLGFGAHFSETEHNSLRSRLLSHYLADIASATQPFSGITELLANIVQAGLSWGIVTNKPRPYTAALLQALPFAEEAATVVCPEDAGVSKPAPEPLWLACRQLNAEPGRCLYVGDHARDIECGRRAGVITVAVGYGFTSHPEEYRSWGADHCARTPGDLWPIVASYIE